MQTDLTHCVCLSLRSSLSPTWQALHSMCTQLSAAHSQFIQLLQDLSREISDYSVAQKEKMKANVRTACIVENYSHLGLSSPSGM